MNYRTCISILLCVASSNCAPSDFGDQLLSEPRDNVARIMDAKWYRSARGILSGVCELDWGRGQGDEPHRHNIHLVLPLDPKFLETVRPPAEIVGDPQKVAGFVMEVSAPPDPELLLANMGWALIKNGAVEVRDNMGGLATYEMLRRAADSILKNPMFVDFSTLDALKRQPTRSCPRID